MRLWTRSNSAHLLQSRAWADFKAHYGWHPERRAWYGPDGRPRAAVQLLRRNWPARSRRGLNTVYCPRGPNLDWSDPILVQRVLADLASSAAGPGCIRLKVEPDSIDDPGVARTFENSGWRRSTGPIQFGSTMLLDLSPEEDELLARMKPKTRYNIRLAERRGVRVRQGTAADFDLLYRLYAETSVRDGFVIRQRDYYTRAWDDFLKTGMAQPFLAEVDETPVAGLILYRYAGRAWFLYGMSGSAHREHMPNHALQWAAIRWARQSGCHTYDLWGAPQADDPSDPLWGVHRFKEGFGAQHVRLVGSWDFTLRPALDWAVSRALPAVLSLLRRRQQARTRRMVEPA